MEHTNRTIRPLTQQDLEAYLDIYLNAYPAYKTLDEACREHYREKHRLELREDRQVQTVGLFEGDVLIATMKLILFSMNCFGRMQTACGLMALEVHPLHKKQGVRGSNPRRGTKKSLETQRFQGFSLFAHFLFASNVLVT